MSVKDSDAKILRKRIEEVLPQLDKYRRAYLFAMVNERHPGKFTRKDFDNVISQRSSSMLITEFLEKLAARDMKLQLEPA